MILSIAHGLSEHDVTRAAPGACASFDAHAFAPSSAACCGMFRDCTHGTFRHPAATAAASHGRLMVGATRCPSMAMAAALV